MSKNKNGVDMYGNYGNEPVIQKGNLQKVQSAAPEVSSSVRGDDLRRVQDQLARLEVAGKWAAVIVVGVLAIVCMAPK